MNHISINAISPLAESASAIDELATLEEFRNVAFYFGNKTAESILLFSRTLYKASTKLNKDEFRLLLDSVGFTEGSATTSKYLHIGSQYPSLSVIQDKLPSSWTTVYKIACLPSDKRHDLVAEGKITPATLGNSGIFDSLKNPKTIQRQKLAVQAQSMFDPDEPCLVIKFRSIDRSKKQELDSVIDMVNDAFDASVNLTVPLAQALSNATNRSSQSN